MTNIQLNFKRLNDADYSLEKVFQGASYEWPGDWEGRALLAFTCHYEINKSVVPHLHAFVDAIAEKTNGKGYFGKPFDGVTVDEQQLSGHNWYLRGLLKYAKAFGGSTQMRLAREPVEKALNRAAAYGTAACLREGTLPPKKEDVLETESKIIVGRIL